MRKPFVVVLAAIVSVAVGVGAETTLVEAPRMVVERVQTTSTETTRVTLFDNEVAAVSVREKGEQTYFSYITLDWEDYVGYRAAIDRDVEALAERDKRDFMRTTEANSTIRYADGSGEVQEIRYSLASVSALPLGRLQTVLDDIETFVLEAPVGAEKIRNWQPKIGDVVEMRAGGNAVVIDIREGEWIELEHMDVGIVELVPKEHRVDAVLRVIEP